jgi:hypothetical protein
MKKIPDILLEIGLFVSIPIIQLTVFSPLGIGLLFFCSTLIGMRLERLRYESRN